MLNTTVYAPQYSESHTTNIESDKRVSVQVADGEEMRIVEVGSEQYKHFTNGDSYLIDSQYMETKYTLWSLKWYDYRDIHIDGHCNVYRKKRIYLTQPVVVKSITLDGAGKAIFTYIKSPQKHKLLEEAIEYSMVTREDGETAQQAVDRKNEWERFYHSDMIED